MEIPDIDLENGTYIVAEIGAVNWGVKEVFNTNLVTELLGTGNEGAVYVAVGAAGAVALAEKFELVDVLGE